jgi:predicted AAA+ superfamily ATPase
MDMNRNKLHRLLLYRGILDDPIIIEFMEIIEVKADSIVEERYYSLISKLINSVDGVNSKNLWKKYITELILNDENIISLKWEKGDMISEHLNAAAINDFSILRDLYNFNWNGIINYGDNHPWFNREMSEIEFNQGNWEELFNGSIERLIKEISTYYRVNGCGLMSRYRAFRWDNGLKGIKDIDKVTFDDLIGYKTQKEILKRNTEAFLKGEKSNNILLFGDRGTGKSSSVKALLNMFSGQGLRIIEISKMQLTDMVKVIEILKERGKHFIIFIDDLSFEDFEIQYKYFKSIIEGGLETIPKNILIYATSNRRHLIKETWSDSRSHEDEMHATDSVQEKLSLVDRFGITITFQSPSQQQYLEIVEKLAKRNGISISHEELTRRAIEWELTYHGRSGRTAQQFIIHLLGHVIADGKKVFDNLSEEN